MAKIKYDGDARGAERAARAVEKGLGRIEDEAGAVGKELDKMNKLAERLGQQADPLKKYRAQMDQLARAVRDGNLAKEDAIKLAQRYERQLNKTTGVGLVGFGRMASSIGGLVSGYFTLQAAVAAVTNEMEAQRRIADEINQTQMTVGQAQQQMRVNIAGLSPQGRALAESEARRISRERGVDLGATMIAMGDTVSAVGGAAQAASLVDVAAGVIQDPGQFTALAASLGDIINNVPGVSTPQDALGFLATTAQNSRMTNIALAGRATARVTSAFGTQGGDPAMAASMLASMSKTGGDATGDRTANAIAALPKKMRDFLRRQGFAETAIDTVAETRALLMGDPALAQEFLRTGSFEAASVGAITDFFTGGVTQQRAMGVYGLLGNQQRRMAAGAGQLEFAQQGALQQRVRGAGQAFALQQQGEAFGEAYVSREEQQKAFATLSRAGRSELLARMNLFRVAGITVTPEEMAEFLQEEINVGMNFAHRYSEESIRELQELKRIYQNQFESREE